MTTQVNNSENVELLSAHFARRNEPNQAWKSAVASLMGLPYLRGAWPMSSVGYAVASRGIDVSGQANHLTDVNAVTFSGGTPLHSYAAFVGASSQALTRADGGATNWADITGTETYVVAANRGLTLGCWVYFTAAPAAVEGIAGKYGAAGQRSYRLTRAAGGQISAIFSSDGTNTAAPNGVTQTSTVIPATSTWTFVATRFRPSVAADVWINDAYTSSAAAPASIFDSATDFSLASLVGGTSTFMSGRISLAFLCAGAVADTLLWSFYQQTRKAFGV